MAEGDTLPLLWSLASDSESDVEIHVEGKSAKTAVANNNRKRDSRTLPSSAGSEEEEDAVHGNHLAAALWTPAANLPGVDSDGHSSLWSSAPEINATLRIAGKKLPNWKSAVEETALHGLLQSQSDTEADVEAVGELRRERSTPGETHGNGIQEIERKSLAARLTALVRPRGMAADDITPESSSSQERRRANGGAVERQISTLNRPQSQSSPSIASQMSDRVPPEWVLLLVGCLLGLSSGISVVIFNKGVYLIHDLAWAGTPHEGAAWLRTQSLAVTWHRILLIPVFGGVVVGMFHSVNAILDMIQSSQPRQSSRGRIDWLAGIKPVIKAVQAATTLGTGCSLGPEGPSVDIGRSWAHGFAEIMKNSKESRIALVAAGAAAGIASG
jgi:hypothetical protein